MVNEWGKRNNGFWSPLEKYGGFDWDETIILFYRLICACSFSKSSWLLFIVQEAWHSKHVPYYDPWSGFLFYNRINPVNRAFPFRHMGSSWQSMEWVMGKVTGIHLSSLVCHHVNIPSVLKIIYFSCFIDRIVLPTHSKNN